MMAVLTITLIVITVVLLWREPKNCPHREDGICEDCWEEMQW